MPGGSTLQQGLLEAKRESDSDDSSERQDENDDTLVREDEANDHTYAGQPADVWSLGAVLLFMSVGPGRFERLCTIYRMPHLTPRMVNERA